MKLRANRDSRRWYVHDYATLAAAIVLPLSGETRPVFLGSTALKQVVLLLACFLIAMSLLYRQENNVDNNSDKAIRRIHGMVILYVIVVSILTMTRTIPSGRIQLFATFILSVLSYFVVERQAKGRFVLILYVAALFHLSVSVIFDVRSSQFGNGDRLTGGFTPVFLGFEASMVLWLSLYCLLDVKSLRRRIVSWFSIVLACYVLIESYSRAALIAVFIGILLILVVRTSPRFRLIISCLVGFVLSVTIVLYSKFLLDLLNADADGLVDASGRTDIWSRIFSASPDLLRGYGFGALRDGLGPDMHIFQATRGFPAENAYLQALLVSGVIGSILFTAILMSIIFLLASRSRGARQGIFLAVAVTLFVNSVYSVGISGQTAQWWWLLGCIGLVDRIEYRGIGRIYAKATKAPDMLSCDYVKPISLVG